MSRAVTEDDGVNPTEEAIAMSDTLIKDNVSKNAAVEGARGGATETMSKFAADLYKPGATNEAKSDMSKAADEEFKKWTQRHEGTDGGTKDMPNHAVENKAVGDADKSKTLGDLKNAPASSAEKCLPNLNLFDSQKHFDANPNANELPKNPALDSQKDTASKDTAKKDSAPKDLQMFHPQSADIPIVKGQ